MSNIYELAKAKTIFWVAFRGDKRTSFLLLDGDPESVHRKITTRVIIEVYRIFLYKTIYLFIRYISYA
jgi:hypothetical protein